MADDSPRGPVANGLGNYPGAIPLTRPQKLFRLLILIIVATAAVGGGHWYVRHLKNTATEPERVWHPVMFSVLGDAAHAQLYVLNEKKKTMTPVMVPGVEGTVMDAARDGDIAYYLIRSANGLTSNIYSRDLSTNGNLVQVTKSDTYKYDLSYDPAAKMFVYLSASITSEDDFRSRISTGNWDVMVATLSRDGVEGKVLTTGSSATMSNGIIVVEKADGLYGYDYYQPENKELYHLSTSVPYALSPDRMLVVYNPVTHALDSFTMASGLAAISYVSSLPINGDMSAFAYEKDALVGIVATDKGYQVTEIKTGDKTTYAQSLKDAPTKLFVLYE